MAAVNITFQGMFYDKISRVYYQDATMVGIAFLTDLSIGGGPIIPPGQPPGGGGGNPPWWPGHPEHPIPPRVEHPIVLPPEQVPPDMKPPQPPQPGDPTTIVPPPAGSAGWPVQPIVPPPYIVVSYPGIGPVVVAPPETAA